MRRRALLVLLLAVDCGGQVTTDVDAAVDASIDFDAHWGECCDKQLGGLGRPCVSGELDAGLKQCTPDSYCGLYPSSKVALCCGAKGSSFPIDMNCAPWPTAFEASWGDCCYNKPSGPWGGVLGTCPEDASASHTQCSPNQYCGQSSGPGFIDGAVTPSICCGDRTKDLGTPTASGIDSHCPPVYWQL